MKTPIKPGDIRKGDLIRGENYGSTEMACEFRALWDGHTGSWSIPATWFLLDRPTPPDPFTPGSVWYAKEGFTTRFGHKVERGERVVMKRPNYPVNLQPGEVVGVVNDGLNRCYLPKDMLVAERPEPLVVLPVVPTYGLLTWKTGPNTADPDRLRTVTAEWYRAETISGPETRPERRVQMHAKDLGLQVPVRNITAFTEASVIPKAAMDDLREEIGHWSVLSPNSVMGRFLAAVDAAGEGK